jgi:hypothetical protein
VPGERSGFRATVEVSDPEVREAFVRVARYDRATGRPRQFALTEARFVRAGETATLEVALDPPAGAVAYRVRVLARLRTPAALSAPEAVKVILSAPFSWLAGFAPTGSCRKARPGAFGPRGRTVDVLAWRRWDILGVRWRQSPTTTSPSASATSSR